MRLWQVALYLYSIYVVTITAIAFGEENFLNILQDYVDDLKYYCPYTSFCSSDTSDSSDVSAQNFDASSNGTLCCRSCSCKKDCGLTKICCYEEDDIYKRGEKDCISTEIGHYGSTSLRYYMIQNCTNGEDVCQDKSVLPWGPISPVYSPTTKLIYLNTKCARCNDVHDVITWDIKFLCQTGQSIDQSMSDEISALLSGKKAQTCTMMFMPPDTIDVTDLSCSDQIIRECFALTNREKLNISEEIIKLCYSFNATYTVNMPFQRTQLKFGNVFCAMCNLEDEFHEKNGMCANVPFRMRSPFTPVMVGLLSGVRAMPSEINRPEVCREPGSSKTKAVCKPLICPEGRIRVNEDCKFLVSLRGERFVLCVRLTPTNYSSLLPISHFATLSSYKLSRALWLYRHNFQTWKPIVYYRLNKDKTHVKFLVVALYYDKEMELSTVLKKVDEALKLRWYAVFEYEKYYYNAKLNRFTQYKHIERNIYRPKGDPFNLVEEREDEGEDVHALNMERNQLQPNSIQINQFYFCEQVDLFPAEYRTTDEKITINVNNVTLKKIDYRYIGGDDGILRVRVCAGKWLQSSSKAQPSLDYTFLWNFFFTILLFLNPFNADF